MTGALLMRGVLPDATLILWTLFSSAALSTATISMWYGMMTGIVINNPDFYLRDTISVAGVQEHYVSDMFPVPTGMFWMLSILLLCVMGFSWLGVPLAVACPVKYNLVHAFLGQIWKCCWANTETRKHGWGGHNCGVLPRALPPGAP
jgi:hypothetical protein